MTAMKTSFTHAWAFSVHVHTPKVMRAPGLQDPDNWNVEALEQVEWDSAGLVGSDIFDEMRAAAPEGTLIESTTIISVLVETDDKQWFDDFYASHDRLNLVDVHQTPTQIASEGESTSLYMYDRQGMLT